MKFFSLRSRDSLASTLKVASAGRSDMLRRANHRRLKMRFAVSMLMAVLMMGLPGVAGATDEGPVVAALDHVALSVVDADKSAQFYEQLFGFRRVPAPVPMARWLVMGNGVMLHIVGNRSAPMPHSRWDHIALACGDLDVLIAKLDARRIAWTNMEGGHTPQVRADGVRQIFIQDPDGYWLELNDAGKKR